MGSGRKENWGKKASCWENQRNPGFWAPNLLLDFGGLQDQGTRKRIINGPELGCILWRAHLYAKLNNTG